MHAMERDGDIWDDPHITSRYDVMSMLGGGGNATVYRVRDRRSGEELALKALHPRLHASDAAGFEARFTREVTILSQVSHASLVQVRDFGFYGETRLPYLTMELLEGETLEARLRASGAMEPKRFFTLFLEALEALHERGIVHRDLKPDNLFLAQGDGREVLVLLDLGLAAFELETELRLTRPGQILGTPRYLAPEYILTQQVSPALDVYQMGIILVEALSGEPVIADEELYAIIEAHCEGELNISETLRNSALMPVLKRALVVDPKLRYPSAGAFSEALGRLNPRRLLEPESARDIGAARTLPSLPQLPAIAPNASQEETAAQRNAWMRENTSPGTPRLELKTGEQPAVVLPESVEAEPARISSAPTLDALPMWRPPEPDIEEGQAVEEEASAFELLEALQEPEAKRAPRSQLLPWARVAIALLVVAILALSAALLLG